MGEVVFQRDIDCTMHAALENALDVPHTAFLHGGLFRKSGQGPQVQAERHDLTDGVEVRFVGEPAAFGPLRLPGGRDLRPLGPVLPAVDRADRVPHR